MGISRRQGVKANLFESVNKTSKYTLTGNQASTKQQPLNSRLQPAHVNQ